MSCSCLPFDTVSTSEIGIVERYGAFNRLSEAGCVPIMCPCEAITGRVSLKVQQLLIECETKTKDNVFVTIFISVQYQAIRDKVYN